MKKIKYPMLLVGMGLMLTLASYIPWEKQRELDLQIEKAGFIMPAAHRVYADPDALDGKYYLFKAKIDNRGSRTLEDVTLRYRIPGYIDWTELEVSGQLFPGQSMVVPCYPKFNDDITEKTTSSIEKVELEVSWDGADEDDIVEEDFKFKLTNRNEYAYTGIKREEISGWADVYDNNALIACFVTPNDPVVKYYTQNLQEKILKGEAASVTRKPEDGVRFLTGIYEATRKAHMVYSGTKGIPQRTDDVESMVQQVRLPREVITGNTGLCIELSTLYASILSAAGLDPVIYFIPGHAYPGFRMNGQYFAIEATGISGEGLGGIASAEEAFKKGQEQLQEFIQRSQMGDPRYTLVDIHLINQQGVTSMDLKDDASLRKKVDEIAARWGADEAGGNYVQDMVQRTGGNIPAPKNALSMTIPTGWQILHRPEPQLPMVTAQVVAPDQMTTVTIYDLRTTDLQQAMRYINQGFSQLNMSLQYQANGNAISGLTYSEIGTFKWIGKALPRGQGMRIVSIGAPDFLYQQNSNLINQVYNTIR
ncbi:hypothetical protein [Sediminicola luteus]|uniref:Uncharacterized protein n=1 Tax=Sediminicola luteus TaxID=319238 RepID=A0A2A4G4R4_9FLAO|nr:hypothetical protein [Sediminicola luteus]PCE62976.1 hypothetical protein B7P33_17015 [Sediminicola luteus]